MLDIMYDLPFQDGVKSVKIRGGVISKGEAPGIVYEKEKKSA